MPNVWQRPRKICKRTRSFFLICLYHDSLQNFYKMNFALMQYHKYSLREIEEMILFEREIYVAMLIQYLEEEKQRLESKKV